MNRKKNKKKLKFLRKMILKKMIIKNKHKLNSIKEILILFKIIIRLGINLMLKMNWKDLRKKNKIQSLKKCLKIPKINQEVRKF